MDVFDTKPTMVLSEVTKNSCLTTTQDASDCEDEPFRLPSDHLTTPKRSPHVDEVGGEAFTDVSTHRDDAEMFVTAVSEEGALCTSNEESASRETREKIDPSPEWKSGGVGEVEEVDERTSSSEPPSRIPVHDTLNDYGFRRSPRVTANEAVGSDRVLRQSSLPRRSDTQPTRVTRSVTSFAASHRMPPSPVPPPGARSYIVPGPRGAKDILLEGEEELDRPPMVYRRCEARGGGGGGGSGLVSQCQTTSSSQGAEGREEGRDQLLPSQTVLLPWWRRWFCGTPVPPPPPVVMVSGSSPCLVRNGLHED